VCNQKAQQEYQNLEEVKRRQVAPPPSPSVSSDIQKPGF